MERGLPPGDVQRRAQQGGYKRPPEGPGALPDLRDGLRQEEVRGTDLDRLAGYGRGAEREMAAPSPFGAGDDHENAGPGHPLALEEAHREALVGAGERHRGT